MVRLGMAAAALALMASPLLAQESSEQLKKELQELRAEVDALKAVNTTKEIPSSGKVAQDAMAADDNPVMTLFKQTKLSGFVDAGYQVSFNHMHKENASTNHAKPGAGSNPIRIFDDRADSFYLNAVQLNLERLASKDMIVGYHLELAAGHDPLIYDGRNVTLQEGWLQIMAPLGNGLDIRVGKMATLAGYEVLENVNNMNYSRGMLFGLVQPFTNTGIRASYWFVDQLGATIGFTNGLNAGTNDQFSDDDQSKMVEFQVAAKPMKDLSITATLMYGHESNISASTGDGVYLFDLVVAYTMDKLTVALNFDKASIQGVANNAPGTRGPLSGIALYAKYAFTDTLSEALRIEYFSDHDGFLLANASGSRVVGITATTEMKVAQQLILRAELRADNSNDRIFTRGGGSTGADRAARGDYTLGFEAIMPF